MAKAELMVPWIKKFEGGWANDLDDSGGCTMSGVTIGTYRRFYGRYKTCENLKHITEEEWMHVFKAGYWDPWRADDIENQSIAQICVQMGWGSGVKTAIRKVQAFLGVTADGIVGPITLDALNSGDHRKTFEALKEMRKNWLIQIAKRGNNKKFLDGWLRRLDSIQYIEDTGE